jgi:hypothetical protein
LTKQHALERGGMAKTEFRVRCFQPLSHLSVAAKAQTSMRRLCIQRGIAKQGRWQAYFAGVVANLDGKTDHLVVVEDRALAPPSSRSSRTARSSSRASRTQPLPSRLRREPTATARGSLRRSEWRGGNGVERGAIALTCFRSHHLLSTVSPSLMARVHAIRRDHAVRCGFARYSSAT